jgi:hypothetical protein
MNCPAWCVDNAFDVDLGDGRGGVTVSHSGRPVDWSQDGECSAWLARLDGYADQMPAAITIGGREGELVDISPDEARRLAAVLLELADEL